MFSREFSLPDSAVHDGSKIKASFQDGILKVVVPKIEDKKKGVDVPIQRS